MKPFCSNTCCVHNKTIVEDSVIGISIQKIIITRHPYERAGKYLMPASVMATALNTNLEYLCYSCDGAAKLLMGDIK